MSGVEAAVAVNLHGQPTRLYQALAAGGLADVHNEELIRPDIRDALDQWGKGQPHPTGDFLRAVLTNDLRDAAVRADDENALALVAIVRYCNTYLPDPCWGSEAKYEAWWRHHLAFREKE